MDEDTDLNTPLHPTVYLACQSLEALHTAQQLLAQLILHPVQSCRLTQVGAAARLLIMSSDSQAVLNSLVSTPALLSAENFDSDVCDLYSVCRRLYFLES